VELTFSDINATATYLGISDINNVSDWNTYLATLANAYTFDDVQITGNTAKLTKADTSGIIFMNFQNMQLTNFDIKGFNDDAELYLDGNTSITLFNPTDIPNSLVTLSFMGCGLTTFNPTSPMPPTIESIILNSNYINTSSWNTDTAWIASLPMGGGLRIFNAEWNWNTVTGTATESALIAKGWTITP
jgi:hypothetical protein